MNSYGKATLWAASLTLAVCAIGVSPAIGARDPLVTAMASEVDSSSVTALIETLVGFQTRYSFTTQCDDSADWLQATMEQYGLEVSVEEFEVSGKVLRNIVGRLEGTLDPDRVFVLGAHYDSTSAAPWDDAPGADDNASGVAGLLEAARVLSAYEFKNTLEFIAFGGEEQGRRGSQHNAAQAALSGKNIVGMINLDMIGYWPESSDRELDIGKNSASSWLANLVQDAAQTYASIPVRNWPDTGVCYDDQASYWDEGFDAVVLMDCYEAHADPGGSGESTPHYHSSTDTIETLDLAQTTEAVRATVASMALLAEPVVVLRVAKLESTGDVQVAWAGGTPPYILEACPGRDFSAAVIELTPPGGVFVTEWTHDGALDDGVDHYYRVRE